MKKKWSTAAAAVALLLAVGLFTACGNAADSGGAGESAAGLEPANTAAPAPPDSPSLSAFEPAPAVGDTEVVYNGVTLTPNGDAAPALAALGEPLEYSEMISCMFEGGMDKTYVYAGLTLYTYPTETQELILLIEVTSPDVQTSRGVRVNDSLDAALLAYNDVIAPETEIRYTAVFGEVLFSIVGEEGVVKSMTYELDKAPIS